MVPTWTRMFFTISCKACKGSLCRPMRKVTAAQWTEWAREFGRQCPWTCGYSSMPLTPYGTFVHWSASLGALHWGPERLFREEWLGGTSPDEVVFLAPDELSARKVDDGPWGCCGPVANVNAPETLHCRCGAPIGWEHRDCIGPAEFVRLNLRRVDLHAAGPENSPTFVQGEFNATLFELAKASQFRGSSRAVELTDIVQLLEHAAMFDTDKGVYWAAYPHADLVRVYLGKGDHSVWDPSLPPADGQLLEVSFGLWYEHLRYVAGLEMEGMLLSDQ